MRKTRGKLFKGGNYSGRKVVHERIQKWGNYSKQERNKRQETIQGNTAVSTETSFSLTLKYQDF